MVRPAEVAAVVPSAADRSHPGPQPERALRRSGLLSGAKLAEAIQKRAKALGFDAIGTAPGQAAPLAQRRLADWLAEGRHGDMLWMAETPERRASPEGLWPEVRSVIMLGVNYGTTANTLALLDQAEQGSVALYARRRDYHDTIKGRLKELAGFIVARAGDGDVKVFVDTAPVLEKTLAEAAGLGWQGKNTMLVSHDFGSWLFLGAIYTTLDLPCDQPATDACGSCTRCLDVCPTKAFPASYQLDARRCISYLTIEHKGLIPREFRNAIGNRIFGCDDCLAVCPWNKFAQECSDTKLAVRAMFDAPDLAWLAGLDDATFRTTFAGTPIKRTGRDKFVSNVLIAIGNSGTPALADAARSLLQDPSPVVRGSAVWALSRLLLPADLVDLADAHQPAETAPEVISEWHNALNKNENEPKTHA